MRTTMRKTVPYTVIYTAYVDASLHVHPLDPFYVRGKLKENQVYHHIRQLKKDLTVTDWTHMSYSYEMTLDDFIKHATPLENN